MAIISAEKIILRYFPFLVARKMNHNASIQMQRKVLVSHFPYTYVFWRLFIIYSLSIKEKAK